MDNGEIKEQLIELLNVKFDINKNVAVNHSSSSLFLSPFLLGFEDLVLLVTLLMEKYSIVFKESDFFNYKFSTINNIAEIVSSKLNKKGE